MESLGDEVALFEARRHMCPMCAYVAHQAHWQNFEKKTIEIFEIFWDPKIFQKFKKSADSNLIFVNFRGPTFFERVRVRALPRARAPPRF